MVELRKLKLGDRFRWPLDGNVYVKDRFWDHADNTYLVRDLRGIIAGKLCCHEMVVKL